MTAVLSAVAPVLTVMGALGVLVSAVRFVRVTLPQNYGSNPGFGAFESSALPWWLLASVGIGLRSGWRTGVLTFALGFIALSVLALLLGRVFGRSS